MQYKEDWPKAQERFIAWWNNEIIDRMVIQVTAPNDESYVNPCWSDWDLVHNLETPENVIQNFKQHCSNIFFGGEAFPNLSVNFGPGVVSAFIGAEPVVREDTVWFETPRDWDTVFKKAVYNPDSKWWKYTKFHTEKVTEFCENSYFPAMTDLGGNLDILSSLRGVESLLFDLLENSENVKNILKIINKLWLRYFTELNQIMQKKVQGTSNWMPLWSPGLWYPLQCDFSAMISPKLFEEFVAPFLEEQCTWLDNVIYHWDGPGELPHLDVLLEISGLDGFQWTPGSGNPGVGSPKWFPYYKKIQEKKKLLVLLDMDQNDIEGVMKELSPNGLLIMTRCKNQSDAKQLIKNVERWTHSK